MIESHTCPNCGKEISVSEEKCPYCGDLNRFHNEMHTYIMGQYQAINDLVYHDVFYRPRIIQGNFWGDYRGEYIKLFCCSNFIFQNYVQELSPSSRHFEDLLIFGMHYRNPGMYEGYEYAKQYIMGSCLLKKIENYLDANEISNTSSLANLELPKVDMKKLVNLELKTFYDDVKTIANKLNIDFSDDELLNELRKTIKEKSSEIYTTTAPKMLREYKWMNSISKSE